MGEALMPRRGGVVKRGTVTAWTEGTHYNDCGASISDPALVNAKSAVVYLAGATPLVAGTSKPHLVTTVIIEDGEIAKVICAVDAAYSRDDTGRISYDPLTGTLSSVSYSSYRFGMSNGTAPYDYIVFD